jgi:hypothetical protein
VSKRTVSKTGDVEIQIAGDGGPICPKCGASDWGTRNRCNSCRAQSARGAWAGDPEASRAKDSARHRAWRRANPEKARAQKRRSLYRLDAECFAALLVEQDDRCAICRSPDPACVDHCHVTGRVRGILCRSCNTALGQFRDDPTLLLAASAYVEEARN